MHSCGCRLIRVFSRYVDRRLVNDVLFQLLVFGMLVDWSTGDILALNCDRKWKIFLEIPFDMEAEGDVMPTYLRTHFPLLPLLGQEQAITYEYPYDFDEDARLVCQYLHAYFERHPEYGLRLIDQLYEQVRPPLLLESLLNTCLLSTHKHNWILGTWN